MDAESDLLPTEWMVCNPSRLELYLNGNFIPFDGASIKAYVLDSASLGNELNALKILYEHPYSPDYTDNCLVVNKKI